MITTHDIVAMDDHGEVIRIRKTPTLRAVVVCRHGEDGEQPVTAIRQEQGSLRP